MTKSFAKIANAKNKNGENMLLVMLLVYGTKVRNFIDLCKYIVGILYGIAYC